MRGWDGAGLRATTRSMGGPSAGVQAGPTAAAAAAGQCHAAVLRCGGGQGAPPAPSGLAVAAARLRPNHPVLRTPLHRTCAASPQPAAWHSPAGRSSPCPRPPTLTAGKPMAMTDATSRSAALSTMPSATTRQPSFTTGGGKQGGRAGGREGGSPLARQGGGRARQLEPHDSVRS